MRRFRTLADGTMAVLASVALIAMMLHTVLNAVSRRFLGAPLPGTSELVAYWYLPVIALVGFVVAHWRSEHIRVSLVTDRLRARNRTEFEVLDRSLGIVVSLALAWFGLHEALRYLEVGMTAGVTSLIIWPVSFLVPAVFVLLAASFAADILRATRGRVSMPDHGTAVAPPAR